MTLLLSHKGVFLFLYKNNIIHVLKCDEIKNRFAIKMRVISINYRLNDFFSRLSSGYLVDRVCLFY